MSNQTLSWQWKVQRRSLCPINVCGFPSSQYDGVQHVCTLTAASCKRTCQCKQLLFERIKITLRLRTNLELNPVNTGVLRIDLQGHLLHTRKTHLSRICNDFKPNYMQHLRSTILAQKHKQQQQQQKIKIKTPLYQGELFRQQPKPISLICAHLLPVQSVIWFCNAVTSACLNKTQ